MRLLSFRPSAWDGISQRKALSLANAAGSVSDKRGMLVPLNYPFRIVLALRVESNISRVPMLEILHGPVIEGLVHVWGILVRQNLIGG